MNHYGIEDCPGPLFAQRAPSVPGSVTSAAAADSLDGKTLNAMQLRVLRFLQTCIGGDTDEQMQLALGMNPSTQRPRRGELAEAGLIVESGSRLTSSRRRATVWRAAK